MGLEGVYRRIRYGAQTCIAVAVPVLSAAQSLFGAGLGSVHGWGNYSVAGRPLGVADAIDLKASAGYTYVLRSDGTIALWGDDSNGQLDAPPGLTNVVAISAGFYAGMALTGDGRVHVWGAGGSVYRDLMINPPADLTNVVGISAGMDHCLALKGDGTVVAWGSDLYGGIEVPSGLSNVVRIAAGQDYSLAITADGQTVVWGATGFYGLPPPEATNLVSVSLSIFGHAVALRKDGIVVCWGSNESGQATVPAGLSNVVAVAAGLQHSIALKSDGSLVAWGLNDAGQATVPANFVIAKAVAAGTQHNVVISDAPLVDDVSPDQYGVPAGSDLVLQAHVAASAPWTSYWVKDGLPLAETNTTLLIHDVQAPNAGIYSFTASNSFGSTSSRGVSVYINDVGPRWNHQPLNQAVLQGQTAVFVADVSGSEPLIFEWSHNGIPIPGATNATLQISPVTPADEGAYGVRVSNAFGSITNEPCFLVATLPRLLSEPTDRWVRTNWVISLDANVLSPLPVVYQWYKDGQSIAGATNASLPFFAVQLTNAGSYFVEVSNQNGPVRSDPVRVTILSGQVSAPEPGVAVEWGHVPYTQASTATEETNLIGVAVGDWHTLLLRNDSTVRLWGDPQDTTLASIPPEATNVAQVFCGPSYALVLRKDATVVTWGGITSGLGLTNNSPGNSNVVSAAAGAHGCILLHADGTVAMFPDSFYVPPEVTNITQVAMTGEYSAGLQDNGRILVWTGYQGVPSVEVTGLDKVVAIAGGENYASVALRTDGTVADWSFNGSPTWNLVAGISNAAAVAAGRGSMALLQTGQVVSWGGQSANPPAGLNANQIAFELLHQAALTPAPFFDLQPQSQTFSTGTNVTLTAAVRSATALSFQWYFENTPIPNATNLALQFVSARPSQSGHYKLVASNAKYTAESQVAVVSVVGVAEFLQTSSDQHVQAGDTLQIQVQYVANPSGAAQWQFNGTPIPFTNATLMIPDVQAVNAGVYTLSVSNSYGSVSSPPIQVTVSPSAPRLISLPSAPAQVPDGTSLPLTVVAAGSEPLAYQWFLNNVQMAGQTQSTLQLGPISQADDGAYFVVVTNAIGSTSTPPVMVTTIRSAPAPVVLPQHLLVRAGKSFSLHAVPGGTPGSSFQWRFNGQDLVGETNNVLVISTAAASNAGPYSVVAVNAYGTNESAPAAVRVLPNPGAGLVKMWGSFRAPTNPLLAEAVAAGLGQGLALLPDGTVQAWGDNSYLQATVPGGLSNVVAIAAGQDFSLALRSDGTVVGWGHNDVQQATPQAGLGDVIAIAAGQNHALALRSDGSVIGWGKPNYTRIPTNLPSLASIAANAGYSLAIDSTGLVRAWGAPNPLALTNVPPSATNAIGLAAGGTTAYALQSSGLTVAWPSGAYRPPPDATNLVFIAAGGVHGVGLRADAKLFTWGINSSGQVSGPQGQSNILAVAAGGQTTLAISAEPRILSIPSSHFVRQGGSVTLSVSAIGTAPLRYLWSFNGQPLAGATNVTYVIDSFDPTNAGTYSIQVQNGYASVKTNLVTLSLGNRPVITTQPADQAVTAGSNAVFTVQCSGSPPLVYQWALNATNLLGANSSSLTLSNVVVQQQGTITVLITNLFGATLSRSAMLEVLPGPSLLSLALTNGSLQFQLSLQANRQYSLLTSSNLVDWVPVQPLSTSGTNLTLLLTLPQDPVRFYRLQDQTGP